LSDAPSPGDPTPGDPIPGAPVVSRRATLREGLRKVSGYSDQLTVEQQIKRRTFLSFSAFFLLGTAAWKSWFWIKDSPQREGVQAPLRQALYQDENFFKHTLSPGHLAKTYPRAAAATHVRQNGNIGLNPAGFDAANWMLQVAVAGNRSLAIGLGELRQLPKTEVIFEFKCIEGWSQVSWWGGVKFSDFVQHYGLEQEAARSYVGLSTPDDLYYVGIDTPSALHPQTLLCYEMNGQPLPLSHGGPLRLIIPVKYGVKNLKRISKLYFSDDRPRDYWFERGYDYYCGL
jgi:DMSO/TMAO reductase YedYZ molybdopterin-dependent catalytic subunit